MDYEPILQIYFLKQSLDRSTRFSGEFFRESSLLPFDIMIIRAVLLHSAAQMKCKFTFEQFLYEVEVFFWTLPEDHCKLKPFLWHFDLSCWLSSSFTFTSIHYSSSTNGLLHMATQLRPEMSFLFCLGWKAWDRYFNLAWIWLYHSQAAPQQPVISCPLQCTSGKLFPMIWCSSSSILCLGHESYGVTWGLPLITCTPQFLISLGPLHTLSARLISISLAIH